MTQSQLTTWFAMICDAVNSVKWLICYILLYSKYDDMHSNVSVQMPLFFFLILCVCVSPLKRIRKQLTHSTWRPGGPAGPGSPLSPEAP